MRRCGAYLREIKDKKIFCGRTKTFDDGEVIKEFCAQCTAYNKGYEKGCNKTVKHDRVCSIITCASPADKYICIKDYIIEVCAVHANGKECKPIIK